MSIAAGQKFTKVLLFENDTTGEPIGSDLINDMDIRLYTERSKQIAKLTIGSGITKMANGQFLLELSEVDTIKLKEFVGDNAYLEGYLLPSKLPIVIDLGKILNNRAND